MNILHLKYAVEVEKTGSITQAAENLFMGQPNLSKAIKELETSMGITIFKRTSKGVEVTRKGKELLEQAKSILQQIDNLEMQYSNNDEEKFRFSISVPRASYIAFSFTNFINRLDPTKPMDINYQETNSMQAIKNIVEGNYNLGIIRYRKKMENYFLSYLKDKDLKLQSVQEFKYVALMSKRNPLADHETVAYEELCEGIEIVHGDLAVPFLSGDEARSEDELYPGRRIFIYERGSQFELLSSIPNTFMWVSPIPEELLNKYNMAQCRCDASKEIYKDALIFKKGYNFNDTDTLFIDELNKACF